MKKVLTGLVALLLLAGLGRVFASSLFARDPSLQLQDASAPSPPSEPTPVPLASPDPRLEAASGSAEVPGRPERDLARRLSTASVRVITTDDWNRYQSLLSTPRLQEHFRLSTLESSTPVWVELALDQQACIEPLVDLFARIHEIEDVPRLGQVVGLRTGPGLCSQERYYGVLFTPMDEPPYSRRAGVPLLGVLLDRQEMALYEAEGAQLLAARLAQQERGAASSPLKRVSVGAPTLRPATWEDRNIVFVPGMEVNRHGDFLSLSPSTGSRLRGEPTRLLLVFSQNMSAQEWIADGVRTPTDQGTNGTPKLALNALLVTPGERTTLDFAEDHAHLTVTVADWNNFVREGRGTTFSEDSGVSMTNRNWWYPLPFGEVLRPPRVVWIE